MTLEMAFGIRFFSPQVFSTAHGLDSVDDVYISAIIVRIMSHVNEVTLNLADVCFLCSGVKCKKPPIARLPAIKMDFINRPSEGWIAFMKLLSSDLRHGPD